MNKFFYKNLQKFLWKFLQQMQQGKKKIKAQQCIYIFFEKFSFFLKKINHTEMNRHCQRKQKKNKQLFRNFFFRKIFNFFVAKNKSITWKWTDITNEKKKKKNQWLSQFFFAKISEFVCKTNQSHETELAAQGEKKKYTCDFFCRKVLPLYEKKKCTISKWTCYQRCEGKKKKKLVAGKIFFFLENFSIF